MLKFEMVALQYMELSLYRTHFSQRDTSLSFFVLDFGFCALKMHLVPDLEL